MLSFLLPTVFFLSSTSALVDLIPREVLFQDAPHFLVTLSPDGSQIGFISPDSNGIKNVFMRCETCVSSRQVTFENQSVFGFEWTALPDIILYTQDKDGDENTRLYKKNISLAADQNNRFVISDNPKVKAIVLSNNMTSNTILLGLNDENPAYYSIYSFNLITNKLELMLRNTRFSEMIFDNNMDLRLAGEEDKDGGYTYYQPAKPIEIGQSTNESEWKEYLKVASEDKPITRFLTFDKSNKNMYWILGEGSDLGQLVTFPFSNPVLKEIVYTPKKAEPLSVMVHPTDRTILAVAEFYHKPEITVINDTAAEDFQFLESLKPKGSVLIVYMSLDLKTWLLAYSSGGKPEEYYIYRRPLKRADFLMSANPNIAKYTLSDQIGFEFITRDNLTLQAYLSLPPNTPLQDPSNVSVEDQPYAELGMIPTVPQKMVALVHGGPNARDIYLFNPIVAWLTNRGYAVLQVNFRGSQGFGKKLTAAGNGEWGRKMNFDILDAMEFMMSKGIAGRHDNAIMGASYGGYETLAALAFTPDAFSCGVDIVGPSNLISLLNTIPPYWFGIRQMFVKMFGADTDTEEGREFLKSRSPVYSASHVLKPLMVVQGANDPRVNRAESDQIVAALQQNHIPVTYLLFPDEGHGVQKPNNQMEQNGYIETFLKKCLGGRAQEFTPGQYNSSVIVTNTSQSSTFLGVLLIISFIKLFPSMFP